MAFGRVGGFTGAEMLVLGGFLADLRVGCGDLQVWGGLEG